MGETKKIEIGFTELCDEYEVEVANFNEFYNKVVALAIQVQAPVIKKNVEIAWNDRCPRCHYNAEMESKFENDINSIHCKHCGYEAITGIGQI